MRLFTEELRLRKIVLNPPPGTIYRQSTGSPDGRLRSEIRRWWVEKPERWAAWLMLNPSKANGHREDLTTLRVTHFTKEWGYDGWIGVNCYPYVSSNPAEAFELASGFEGRGFCQPELSKNLRDIERVGREASIRIVAFGSEIARRDEAWLEQCLERFCQPPNCNQCGGRGGILAGLAVGDGPAAQVDCRFCRKAREGLFALGVSKSGYPLHPLARGRMRIPDDRKPVLWVRP
jgi:hypothetical protein